MRGMSDVGCVYMHVCVYMCMYVCMYVYMYAYAYAHLDMSKQLCAAFGLEVRHAEERHGDHGPPPGQRRVLDHAHGEQQCTGL